MWVQPRGGSADYVATWFWRVRISKLGSQSSIQIESHLKRTKHQVLIGNIHLSLVTYLPFLFRPPRFASIVIASSPIVLGRK